MIPLDQNVFQTNITFIFPASGGLWWIPIQAIKLFLRRPQIKGLFLREKNKQDIVLLSSLCFLSCSTSHPHSSGMGNDVCSCYSQDLHHHSIVFLLLVQKQKQILNTWWNIRLFPAWVIVLSFRLLVFNLHTNASLTWTRDTHHTLNRTACLVQQHNTQNATPPKETSSLLTCFFQISCFPSLRHARTDTRGTRAVLRSLIHTAID